MSRPQWPDSINSLSEIPGTIHFLDAGQVEQAAIFLRQYLEFSLLRIIRKLDIPVPLDFVIRDDQKLAGNCLEAIRRPPTLSSTGV
jgi:hypothetical protein